MKVIESHLLYEGKLRAVRETLESPQGKRFAHETIEHPGAVVILPLLEDGRIVFIEQYRHSVRESILELPAGTLEKGEEPEFCAQRELMEEMDDNRSVIGNEWRTRRIAEPMIVRIIRQFNLEANGRLGVGQLGVKVETLQQT